MKIIRFGAAALIFVFVFTAPAFAIKTSFDTPSGSPKAARETLKEKREQNQEQSMEMRKERAYQEIERRVSALNKLIDKIDSMKKISDEQKSTLVSQVQAQISELTALKAKIEADTDPETLKVDKQSIIASYRIFVVFMPKIMIITATDRVGITADKLTDLAGKLETRLEGNTNPEVQSALDDMRSKIADAKEKISNAQTTAMAVTPDGYPGNKEQLKSARQMVVDAIKDLNDARKNAVTIKNLLKEKKSSDSPKPATDTPKD